MIFPILLATVGVVIISFGYLFQKIGLNTIQTLDSIYKTSKGFIWIFGTLLTFLGSFFFFLALGYGDLTIIQPITGLSPAIVSLLSFIVLKNTLHKNELFGIILSVIGIISVSYRTTQPNTTLNNLPENTLYIFSISASILVIGLVFLLNSVPKFDPGLIEGLLAGITAGFASIYAKLGLNLFINNGILHWTLLAFVIMQIAAFISLQKALHHGRIDKIVTLFTSISIVLPVGFGIILLFEPISLINFFGLCMILIGVIILSKNYSGIFVVSSEDLIPIEK
jgi:uncharacterized membrane protein